MLLFLMRLMLSLRKGRRVGGMRAMGWRMRVIGGSRYAPGTAGYVFWRSCGDN
jgi:hypothetical protein